ncbi:MAG: NAD-dependent protein deacylase [Chloroflexi bacterium]|nr:NAD-dependent protein deacylase [Chloroflexota bacterium]
MALDLQTHIDEVARVLTAARHAIAFTGAGISVESGIRPFRGAGGLWTEKGEPPMDGYQRFMLDPRKGWEEMLARRDGPDDFGRALAAAAPNAAHVAIAELESLGVVRHVIAQNIDNLHIMAGTRSITEIHGNRTMARCIDCGRRTPMAEVDVSELPPWCRSCRGIVKSDVVSFGEPIPRDALESCYEQAMLSDCVLCVGTSAVVYPAAQFPEMIVEDGGVMIEVNPDETPLTRLAAIVLRGRAGEVLPRVVAAVRAGLASSGADGGQA